MRNQPHDVTLWPPHALTGLKNVRNAHLCSLKVAFEGHAKAIIV